MSGKLLVADDEDAIRRGVVRYIRIHTDRFDDIYEAADGQEAIDIIIKYKPDVVLLDVQMPIKTGIDVMKEIQKAGLEPAILILSGYDDFRYAQQAVKFGAKDYLLKPVRASEILEAVEKYAPAEVQSVPEYSIGGVDEPPENQIVKAAMEYIAEHYNEDLSLQDVADKVGVSRGYLSTIMIREIEMGFTDYLNQVRIEHACLYLEQNTLRNYEIAYKIGYHDDKYFAKVFKKIKGVSPKEYRKGTSEAKR